MKAAAGALLPFVLGSPGPEGMAATPNRSPAAPGWGGGMADRPMPLPHLLLYVRASLGSLDDALRAFWSLHWR
jgi:hypothetical protein